jgi:type IV pilus assembly protein PilZ
MKTGYSLGMGSQGIGDSERPAEIDPAPRADGRDRRSSERIDVLWSVDCETEDTFLYAAITNISEMGIFVRTDEPLAVGTSVTLRFAPPHMKGAAPATMAGDPPYPPAQPVEPFVLDGVVQWVNRLRPLDDNPNPGMGIRFAHLTLADRERIVAAIRTIAYLREEPRVSDAPRSGDGRN